MNDFVRWFIPIYFAAYFLVAFFGRSYLVWRHAKINPFVLPATDDAYGFVARAFKVCMVLVFALAATHTFAPDMVWLLAPITYLEMPMLQAIGLVLLVISFLWITIAQAQMGASWRIGIDQANRTELVRVGLYKVSRNPIFLGMMVSLLGFFLVHPTSVSLLLLAAAYILISVQIRLEEDHLGRLHGADYEAFMQSVRRWL